MSSCLQVFADKMLKIQDQNFVISLECLKDEMVRRLRKRAESSGRIDDNSEAFRKRLDIYRKESLPVVNHLRKRGFVKIVCIRLDFS